MGAATPSLPAVSPLRVRVRVRVRTTTGTGTGVGLGLGLSQPVYPHVGWGKINNKGGKDTKSREQRI